jgi:predicted DNA binding CopG/RHH family protein
MKPIFNLTVEEQEIENELETGDFMSIPATVSDKDEWAAIARHTLEKSKTINIRLTEKSLIKVKAAAAREGLSYQTFISALIHRNT